MMQTMDTDLELKPNARARVALALLGALALGLAILITSAKHRGDSSPLTAALVLAAIGLPLLGLAVIAGRRRVIIDRDGVEVRGVLSDRRLAWPAMASYSFISIDTTNQAVGVQAGLVGVLIVAAVRALRKKPQNRKFNGGRLVIHGNDGTKLTITPAFRDIDQGLERIFAELHPRLDAITGTGFGKLSFDGHTLSHPSKGALSLPEIEKIVVNQHGVVSIRKVGKRLGWASVRMSAITSSLLLFERLAQRGVVVDMSESVFLPLPTLGLLAQLKAARENLPQARIQRR
jgi:hypothetical protein